MATAFQSGSRPFARLALNATRQEAGIAERRYAAKAGLIIEHVLAPGNASSWGKMLDVQQLVLTNGGRERSEEEYASLLTAAGFKLKRVILTSSTASLIEAFPVAESS